MGVQRTRPVYANRGNYDCCLAVASGSPTDIPGVQVEVNEKIFPGGRVNIEARSFGGTSRDKQ